MRRYVKSIPSRHRQGTIFRPVWNRSFTETKENFGDLDFDNTGLIWASKARCYQNAAKEYATGDPGGDMFIYPRSSIQGSVGENIRGRAWGVYWNSWFPTNPVPTSHGRRHCYQLFATKTCPLKGLNPDPVIPILTIAFQRRN